LTSTPFEKWFLHACGVLRQSVPQPPGIKRQPEELTHQRLKMVVVKDKRWWRGRAETPTGINVGRRRYMATFNNHADGC